MCANKFNKQETYNKHMKAVHKNYQTNGSLDMKAVDWGESHTVENNEL